MKVHTFGRLGERAVRVKTLFTLLLGAVLLLTSGCASMRNNWIRKSTRVLGGDYTVILYSGGHAVRAWALRNGIVDEEAGSDGWSFACHTNLIRLSGDVVVEPTGTAPPLDLDVRKCY